MLTSGVARGGARRCRHDSNDKRSDESAKPLTPQIITPPPYTYTAHLAFDHNAAYLQGSQGQAL